MKKIFLLLSIKARTIYASLISRLYSNILYTFLNRVYNSLKLLLTRPPKAYPFTFLPLQSLCIHGLVPAACAICAAQAAAAQQAAAQIAAQVAAHNAVIIRCTHK